MPWCRTCGQKAPDEIHKMLTEDGYAGEYYCDDECRAKQRSQDESYGAY